jgi:hypothetical protein
MYHRSVIVKKSADARPVTRELLCVMKEKEQKADNYKESVGFQSTSIWSHIADLWTVLLYGLRPKSKQCITYGHTLPATGWVQGRKPKCADCGEAISDPDDLRRSVPRF